MDNLEQTDNFLFYSNENGKDSIQVFVQGETVWMTQKSMSEVFNCSTDNISLHLKNIFKDGELVRDSVTEESSITADDGKKYKTRIYNLDAIISVGYRVNSQHATSFRIWATNVLKEYLIKGFVMDDDRLKQGQTLFGKDYFDELLERIREIRVSERRFYQKVTDLYKTSVDYNPNSPTTKLFFATVQNKLEFAITNLTASEIIKSRADAAKENMGLTTWKGKGKNDKILKTDITVAKNYLSETELSELNRLVSVYLEQAELLAIRGKVMNMDDWADRLNAFLQFNGYEILQNAGTISRVIANKFAEDEFDKFRIVQDKEYQSDFDKTLNNVVTTGKLPVERYDKDTFNGTFTLSVKEAIEDEKRKLNLSQPDQNDE